MKILYSFVLAGGAVTDADGIDYNVVKIGSQIWMLENLKTTKFNNGDLIPVTSAGDVTNEIDTTNGNYPKYQWAYNNDNQNVAKYGRLYTWWTATDSRNICPTGWHVPSNTEFNTLKAFIGSDTTIGGALKEAGFVHWLSPNKGATNSTGFTALPAGYRTYGSYFSIGQSASFWTTTADPTPVNTKLLAYFYTLSNSSANLTNVSYRKVWGLSVRCLKN